MIAALPRSLKDGRPCVSRTNRGNPSATGSRPAPVFAFFTTTTLQSSLALPARLIRGFSFWLPILLFNLSESLFSANLPEGGSPMRITIEEADRLARGQAPGISLAAAQVLMAEARGEGIRSMLLPSLSVTATRSRGERPEGWYGRDSLNESTAGISMQQNLLLFGRYAAAKQEQAGLHGASKIQLKVQERDVARQARLAFIDLLLAHAMTSLYQEAAAHRLQMWEQSKVLFEAGTVTRLGVLAAESEQIAAYEAAERSELAIIRAENILRISIGVARDSLHPVGRLTRAHTTSGLLARAQARLRQGVEFDALIADSARLKGRLEGFRAQGRPRLTLSSNVAYRDDRVIGDRGTDWDCQLTLEWQLADGGHRESMEKETRIELESISNRREDLASGRRSSLTELESRVGLLARRIPEQQQAISMLRRNFDLASGLYQSGQASFESVRDAALRHDHGRLALLELLAEEKRAVEELKAFLE